MTADELAQWAAVYDPHLDDDWQAFLLGDNNGEPPMEWYETDAEGSSS